VELWFVHPGGHPTSETFPHRSRRSEFVPRNAKYASGRMAPDSGSWPHFERDPVTAEAMVTARAGENSFRVISQ
jgi:hypothetical protein